MRESFIRYRVTSQSTCCMGYRVTEGSDTCLRKEGIRHLAVSSE